ncbi:Zinc finger BED domain-containing protein [Melia azedarach]|uniref:Zinc finger BED domain-containing protein n=1 Tax=Melia azedarach TaxID=155640 RepID=A0ACC1YK09_MELAZ|nr:Zinc finger BED domain-containing protein [Melia azedarach]
MQISPSLLSNEILATGQEIEEGKVHGKSLIDLIKSCFDEDGELSEDWDPLVLNSRRGEILRVYEEEKEELRRFFSQLSCRFSLVIELCFGFYFFSIYYIDNSWERRVKIISIFAANKDEELHHNCENLVKILKEFCLYWKIDGNISSTMYHNDEISPDSAKGDHEDVIGEINSWFNQRGNSLPFVGFMFSVDTLSYNFEDDLTQGLWNTFGGVRKCIDYVNSTPSNLHNFQIAVDNAKSMGKKVNVLYRLGNGDSIYDFGRAVGYKEAFSELERIDFSFKLRSINLTAKQWDEATVIYEDCNECLDSLESLIYGEHTTINQCFPKFCELFMTLRPLVQKTQSFDHDQNTSSLVDKLASGLEKYNLVLVIAVILDPRFKMNIVQLWYNKVYGSDADRYLEKIMNDFINVYDKYYAKRSEFGDITSSYLDPMGRPSTSTPKSPELERYLDQPRIPPVEIFDVLGWWRVYTPIFPTLARMARDLLVMPISAYACLPLYRHLYSHIFYCNDLEDDIKPALCCLTQWLKSHDE